MSKIETRHTLVVPPVQTEQTSEASGEEEPSETGRKWVAPPPAALASSYRQTRDLRPNHACLAHSDQFPH
jgi:hypothetical protein